MLKATEKTAHDDERSFTFSRRRRTDDDVKKAELGKKGEIDKATSKKKREERGGNCPSALSIPIIAWEAGRASSLDGTVSDEP